MTNFSMEQIETLIEEGFGSQSVIAFHPVLARNLNSVAAALQSIYGSTSTKSKPKSNSGSGKFIEPENFSAEDVIERNKKFQETVRRLGGNIVTI